MKIKQNIIENAKSKAVAIGDESCSIEPEEIVTDVGNEWSKEKMKSVVVKMSALRNASPKPRGNVQDRLGEKVLDEPLEQRGGVTPGAVVTSKMRFKRTTYTK